MNLFAFTLVTGIAGICYCQIQSNFINWVDDFDYVMKSDSNNDLAEIQKSIVSILVKR